MSTRFSARIPLAAVLAGGLLLSGCGVSDERPRPGAAAQVGDVRIDTEHVDDVVDGTCGYFSDQGSDPVPRSVARQQLVSRLVTQAAVEQLLDDTGASLDDYESYQTDLASFESQLEAVPASSRDDVRAFNEASLVVPDGLIAVGTVLSEADGSTDATADEIGQRGQDALTAWLDDHDVHIDPVYQLAVVDGAVAVDDEGTSVAQSDVATSGLIDILDPEADGAAITTQLSDAAARLPADQLCGG